jgi:hypothetical protein
MNDLYIFIDRIYYNHLETIYNIQLIQEDFKESYGKDWLFEYKQCRKYNDFMSKLKTYNEELQVLYQAVIRQIINRYAADIPDSCTSNFQKIQYLYNNDCMKHDNIEDIVVNLIVKLHIQLLGSVFLRYKRFTFSSNM